MPSKRVLKQTGRTSPSVTATIIFLVLFHTILASTFCFAQTRYVKPSSEVVVRRGQGTEFKIVGIVKDGTAVELLEESEDYAQIRMDDGTEGWILKRFLSDSMPLAQLVEELQNENERGKQKEEEANQTIVTLSSDLDRYESELQNMRAEKEEVETRYNKLERETADVSQLKNNHLILTQEKKSLEQSMAKMMQDYDDLKKDSAIYWFLAGGGVLLIGIIIGRSTAMSRKRKQSLLQ